MIWPHPHYGKERALKEQPWKLEEIERELRAQIELTKREVPQLSHLCDHMGFQALGPEVVALVKRLAGEYRLDIDPEASGVKWVGWDGKPETPAREGRELRSRARGARLPARGCSWITPPSTRRRCGRPATWDTSTWPWTGRA